MIWISKKFTPGTAWAGHQDTLERLQMALAASGNADYSKLLMALHKSEGVDTVYIYVPNEYLARLFPPATKSSQSRKGWSRASTRPAG